MADASIAVKEVEEWIRNERRNHSQPPLNPLLSKEGTSVAQGWWIKR